MTTAVQTAANPAAALFASLNANSSTSTGGSASTNSADSLQNSFLTLLTTQLQNQDPLNPMDNSQMTSQLAQISTVNGIGQLNTTLQSLVSNANASQMLQAAALVGQGVLVPGSTLKLSSGASVGGFDLSGPADQVNVTIKDASGLVVDTMNFGAQAAGTHSFTWDGTLPGGSIAADGAYTVSVSAKQGGQDVSASPLELGVVSGVASTSQGPQISVGLLGSYQLSDIKQVL